MFFLKRKKKKKESKKNNMPDPNALAWLFNRTALLWFCSTSTCFAVQPGLLLGLSNEQAKTCLTVQPGLP